MNFKVFDWGTPDTVLATITFAPHVERTRLGFDENSAPLEEWDRYTISPPAQEDPEWRFTMSGIHTDYLLDEMDNASGLKNRIAPSLTQRIRLSGKDNYNLYNGFFELTRLGLLLPSYFSFMYDLVETEKLPSKARESRRTWKGHTNARPCSDIKYVLVKSLNVIHPKGISETTRKWNPPRYAFAVSGHWREYKDKSTRGHGPTGEVVFGKTWVRTYVKGRTKPPKPGEVNSFRRDPKITINIKQTLAYARDVLLSKNVDRPEENKDNYGKPSVEWMAKERSKMTFGLRYLVLRRDNFRCKLCGISAAEDSDVRLEVDHVLPVSAWGLTVESNLQTLCIKCNQGKKNKK